MQFLTEGMILALLGGAAGVFLSLGMVGVFRGVYLPSDFSSWELLDFRAGVLTLVPVLLAGLLIGLLPAIRASEPNLLTLINSSGYSTGKKKSRVQQVLVIVQIAITFAMLLEASLLVRSLTNWSTVDLGFDYENTLIAHVDLRNAGYSLATIALLDKRITDALYLIPGVRHVGAAYFNAFDGTFHVIATPPDGRTPESSRLPSQIIVTQTYFSSLGIDILAGRGFNHADVVDDGRSAVISETMANHFFPEKQALGECILLGVKEQVCYRVIGIAQDVKYDDVRYFPESGDVFYILPTRSNEEAVMVSVRISPVVFFVYSSGDPEEISAPVQRAISEAAPSLPYVTVQSMQTAILGGRFSRWRFAALGSSLFGILTLLLAIVGLSSTLLQSINQKKKEFAIKRALGASLLRIGRSSVWLGLKVSLIGMGIGTLGGFEIAKAIPRFHYDASPMDAPTIVIVWAIFLVFASVASVVPIYKITKIDLAETLRVE